MLADVMMGQRVVIRHVRRDGAAGPPLSDVVGAFAGIEAGFAMVRTGNGLVSIAVADIVVAKVVAASRRAILDLEAIAMRGWRPAETAELDGWTLRADPGGSRRANSAIALATGSRPLAEVLPEIVRWYAARDAQPVTAVPLPVRESLDAELGRRHWRSEADAMVMTRPLDGFEPAPGPVRVSAAAEDPWFAVSHSSGAGEQTKSLLARHDRVAFAALQLDSAVVGVARGVLDAGWLGITSLRVVPAARRRGAAGQLLNGLLAWGQAQGATQCYLQVEIDNSAAIALYDRLGFTQHHRYHYRRGPS